MTVISFMNQKGGVGKTTSCVNIGAKFSLKRKILLIDTDPQGNLSSNFSINNPKTTIKDALLGKEFEIVEVNKNLHILPSSEDLIGVENLLKPIKELRLKKALKNVKNNYDYIFIDCPPSANILTTNALAISDYTIIPVEASQFSYTGVNRMIDFITFIMNEVNENIRLLGVLLTKYDDRLKATKTVMDKINHSEWKESIFDTVIRINTDIKGAQINDKTIFEYNNKSRGAIDYEKASKEIYRKIIDFNN